MSIAAIVVIIYGVLVALGGIGGYATAKSMMSLISGLASGALLLLSGLLLAQGHGWAKYLAAVVTIALMLFFGSRFLATQKLMPAAPIIVLGIITLAVLFLARGPDRCRNV